MHQGAAFQCEFGVVGERAGVADGDELADFYVVVVNLVVHKQRQARGAAVVVQVMQPESVGQLGAKLFCCRLDVVFDERLFAVLKKFGFACALGGRVGFPLAQIVGRLGQIAREVFGGLVGGEFG